MNIFAKFLKMAILMVVVCLLLLACEAKSNIDINFNSISKNSGTFKMSIKLDDEAASIVRGDSYNPINLLTIFNNEELKKLDFAVSENDNTIEISRAFNSEKELNKILNVLTGKDILNSEINNEATFIKEKREITFNINLEKIKDLYLANDDIKSSLSQNGVDYKDYEALINKAFESTTIKLSIKDNSYNKSVVKNFSASKLDNNKVSLSGEKTRVGFLLGNALAGFCLLLAIFLLYRKWHTPRIISKNE